MSFAGTNYRVGNRWRGRSAQVRIVAGSVQLSCDGQIIRVHRSGMTGPRSTVRFAPRTGGPATDRMRRPEPASRPRQLRVRPTGRAPDPDPPSLAQDRQRRGTTRPKNNVDHVKRGTGTHSSSGYRTDIGSPCRPVCQSRRSIALDEHGLRCTADRTVARSQGQRRGGPPHARAQDLQPWPVLTFNTQSRRDVCNEVWMVVIARNLVRSLCR